MARRIDTPEDLPATGTGAAPRPAPEPCALALFGMIHPMDHWCRPEGKRSPADVAEMFLNGCGAR
jgi:hypothetical protein